MGRYLPRTAGATLSRLASQFPALVLTGPRQAGKTTLVRRTFAQHAYCSLDDPLTREQAVTDPRLLLQRFPPPVILDEIQAAPELLVHVKADIDRHREERGRFVITGSQAFSLMRGVSESLAGRAAVSSLQSMSVREVLDQAEPGRPWRDLLAAPSPAPVGDAHRLAALLLRGGFPEVALDDAMDQRSWYGSYVQTYLERDVRNLRAVGDLHDFRRLIIAIAARTGGLLSYVELGRDLGITGKTVKAWLTLLETTGALLTVTPFHANVTQRLVKRPKAYVLDTGLLAYLLGLTSADQVLGGVTAGPYFEAAVLGQLYRALIHRGELPRLHFWRTAAGHEVDFLIEDGPDLIAVEAKLTATPSIRDAAGIEQLCRLLGPRVRTGLVVCLAPAVTPLTAHVTAVPFGSF